MLTTTFNARAILTAFGATLCIAAIFLTPLAASQPTFRQEPALKSGGRRPVPTLSFDRKTYLDRLTVRRDPFVEPPEIAARTQAERSELTGETKFVVEGILEGKRPRALVQIGTNEQVVAVGDMLDGDTVTEIEGDGIHLSSGRVLRPASGTPR